MPISFSAGAGPSRLALQALIRGPVGAPGVDGDDGAAATIAVGTTTTLAQGSAATVANSGSSSAAIFDFGIPRGAAIAVGFNFDSSTTDADPGAGDFRLNNATPASATAAYFDNTERGGTTVTSWLDGFDDTGDSSTRGILLLMDVATPTTFHLYRVSGSVVDGTGYRKVTIASLGGSGTFTSGNHVAVSFANAGPAATANSFETINCPSGSDPVADNSTDTLNLVASTGLAITGDSSTDTITFAPANDLAALEGMSSTGLVARTASETYAQRTVTGTANQISVSNGDGVAGNPTLSFPSDILVPTVITAPNTGLHLLDSNASHDLIVKPGSNLTADRTWTVTTGDADRNLTLIGDGTVRITLTADTSYNVGAAQTYTTPQALYEYAQANLDTAGYDVICQLTDASLSTNSVLDGPLTGGGRFIVRGDTTTPGNRILTTASAAHILEITNGAHVLLEGPQFTHTGGSGSSCFVRHGSMLVINANTQFAGSTGTIDIALQNGSRLIRSSSYRISGSKARHISGSSNSNVSSINNITTTLVSTPAFSEAFLWSHASARICIQSGETFSGSATGKRFNVEEGGHIFTDGAALDFLPGDAVGTVVDGASSYDGLTGPLYAVTGTSIVAAPAVYLAASGSLDMNSTSDQAITIALLPGYTRYGIFQIRVYEPSISLTTVVGGMYTAAAKGGVQLVASSQVYSSLTATGPDVLASNLNLAANTIFLSDTALFWSFSTPQGAAATAKYVIYAIAMP